MNFKPSMGDPPSSPPGGKPREPLGIRGRIEAVNRAQVPAPKGRGLVMIILAVLVGAGLIWDFSGRGAASQAVRDAVGDGQRPVPKPGPGEVPGTPIESPGVPTGPLQVRIQGADGAVLKLPIDTAAAFLADASEAQRPDLRRQILEALVKPAGKRGSAGREAFEAAARFQEGAGAESAQALTQLTLRAHAALRDDEAAAGAILFLSLLPDRGGALTAAGLDEVIVDATRPLALRIAAAQARPDVAKPSALEALIADKNTHPALRSALVR